LTSNRVVSLQFFSFTTDTKGKRLVITASKSCWAAITSRFWRFRAGAERAQFRFFCTAGADVSNLVAPSYFSPPQEPDRFSIADPNSNIFLHESTPTHITRVH
jgi:hypothetical protein